VVRRSSSHLEGKRSHRRRSLSAGCRRRGLNCRPLPLHPNPGLSVLLQVWEATEANLKTRFFLTHVDQSWKMKLLSVPARSSLSISDRNAYFLGRNPQPRVSIANRHSPGNFGVTLTKFRRLRALQLPSTFWNCFVTFLDRASHIWIGGGRSGERCCSTQARFSPACLHPVKTARSGSAR
jgi:hypothetical protein